MTNVYEKIDFARVNSYRHSTLATYLHMLLLAVCGRFCVDGGNVIPGSVVPLGGHNDERLTKTWRTVETDFLAIIGYFRPNVMPEEILTKKTDRLRAVIVSSANPLRSYANAAGIVPGLPEYLYEAGRQDRLQYTMALFSWLMANRRFADMLPLVVVATRTSPDDSINLDALWSLFLTSPTSFLKNATRAGIGRPSVLRTAVNLRRRLKVVKAMAKYRSIGPLMALTPRFAHAELLYDEAMANRSGLWIGKGARQYAGSKDKRQEDTPVYRGNVPVDGRNCPGTRRESTASGSCVSHGPERRKT